MPQHVAMQKSTITPVKSEKVGSYIISLHWIIPWYCRYSTKFYLLKSMSVKCNSVDT